MPCQEPAPPSSLLLSVSLSLGISVTQPAGLVPGRSHSRRRARGRSADCWRRRAPVGAGLAGQTVQSFIFFLRIIYIPQQTKGKVCFQHHLTDAWCGDNWTSKENHIPVCPVGPPLEDRRNEHQLALVAVRVNMALILINYIKMENRDGSGTS